MRHGFRATALAELALSGTIEGVEFYGRGLDSVYIPPGQEVTLRFAAPEGGKLTLHCDLHEDLKGELYLLDIPIV